MKRTPRDSDYAYAFVKRWRERRNWLLRADLGSGERTHERRTAGCTLRHVLANLVAEGECVAFQAAGLGFISYHEHFRRTLGREILDLNPTLMTKWGWAATLHMSNCVS